MSWQYIRAAVHGGFWRSFQDRVRRQTIPYQWQALDDAIPGAPPSHALENFRVAAGLTQGEHRGRVFQDSDLAKWLEAAGHALAEEREGNAEIRRWVEEAVGLVAAAQQPDGYLNTYYTARQAQRRWSNLREGHELYCAGHFIEAGVAVYRSTKNEKLLGVIRRLADHIAARFGPGEGQLRGYPGHPEVELALVKLYRLTGERRYLGLARYFVEERGRRPSYFEREAAAPDFSPFFGIAELPYYQAHLPVREQTEATGHAVRAMYLATAMAQIALESGDEELGAACERLWQSAAGRRMYVTGGVGSSARREAFTVDYDLPNDTAYAETCAAIGLFLFSHAMLSLRHEGRYADLMERSLYNGIISGVALDGRSFFYVNPLEVVPAVCDGNGTYRHVKYRRQPWYGTACCPPNAARIIASLGEYLYHSDGRTLFADIFHSGRVRCRLGEGEVGFEQRTDYPWSEEVSFTYRGSGEQRFELAVRIPDWCRRASFRLNGEAADASEKDGYARFSRSWHPGDSLTLTLPMPVERVYADPRVRADYGRVALRRGPVVYCLEQADNGPDLHTLRLPREGQLQARFQPELLGGVVTVAAGGAAAGVPAGPAPLYATQAPPRRLEPRTLSFIPYYAWANREPGEMAVWIRE